MEALKLSAHEMIKDDKSNILLFLLKPTLKFYTVYNNTSAANSQCHEV